MAKMSRAQAQSMALSRKVARQTAHDAAMAARKAKLAHEADIRKAENLRRARSLAGPSIGPKVAR